MTNALRTPTTRTCALASLLSLLVLAIHEAVSLGDTSSLFLGWNLFLAWIPYLLALALQRAHRQRRGRGVLLGLGAAWLLFLPNAPYIVTDFVHVEPSEEGLHAVPHAITISAFAVSGLLLAFASLRCVQAVVRSERGATAGWLVAFGSLILSGVGIYLGRFHELNSWDVVTRPGHLLAKTLPALADPQAHLPAFAGTLSAGLLLGLGYFAAYRFAERRSRSRGASKP